MKFYKVFSVFVVLCFVLSMSFTAQPASAQDDPPADPGDYMPGEVVVVFKSGKTVSKYAASAADLAGRTDTAAIKVGKDGMALLRGDSSVDVQKLISTIEQDADVLYAEPNYVYRIPDVVASPDLDRVNEEYVFRTAVLPETGAKETMVTPISYLQSLKSIRGGRVTATFPNDPYLWWNWGWDFVDADIVSPNTTASAGVCVLDTGVDYLHPDLKGRIVKGYDFVNGDTNPMDDFGHGTHVAGIITAKANNRIGMAGASNARVVAVKVLGAQGWGTSFDISMGINYCANRTDVKVLNMSMGGPYSVAIKNAVDYALNTKGKLLVASAGNSNTDSFTYSYPAALSTVFPGKLLSVAASGSNEYVDADGDGYWDYYYSRPDCKADYSNYGSWVNVIAPGTDIYSTTPYDKPFYMNYFYGFWPRYEYLSGTSMAAPFVAAAAARRWGYKPASTNTEVFNEVVNSGWSVEGDGVCWPTSMDGTHIVNVANLMNRYAVEASVADASTGFGLTGATVYAYQGPYLRGSAVISPSDYGYISRKYKILDEFKYYTAYTEVINLPVPTNVPFFYYDNGYKFKAYKSGYTSTAQEIFRHTQYWYRPATLYLEGRASIPPRSSNIDVVMGFNENYMNWGYDNWPYGDLDLNVWLPSMPNPLDAGQPAHYIVGPEGYDWGYTEDEYYGSMNVFPFARWKRDGGGMDYVPIENTTISRRYYHPPLSSNSALPYYPGSYVVGVTDYGMTFDHDNDGGATTEEIPVMGAAYVPYLYIWKDGYIKLYNEMEYQEANGPCNKHWWRGATISSGKTGVITYTPDNACNNTGGLPEFPY